MGCGYAIRFPHALSPRARLADVIWTSVFPPFMDDSAAIYNIKLLFVPKALQFTGCEVDALATSD
jgi:hypothetical protein